MKTMIAVIFVLSSTLAFAEQDGRGDGKRIYEETEKTSSQNQDQDDKSHIDQSERSSNKDHDYDDPSYKSSSKSSKQ